MLVYSVVQSTYIENRRNTIIYFFCKNKRLRTLRKARGQICSRAENAKCKNSIQFTNASVGIEPAQICTVEWNSGMESGGTEEQKDQTTRRRRRTNKLSAFTFQVQLQYSSAFSTCLNFPSTAVESHDFRIQDTYCTSTFLIVSSS